MGVVGALLFALKKQVDEGSVVKEGLYYMGEPNLCCVVKVSQRNN